MMENYAELHYSCMRAAKRIFCMIEALIVSMHIRQISIGSHHWCSIRAVCAVQVVRESLNTAYMCRHKPELSLVVA